MYGYNFGLDSTDTLATSEPLEAVVQDTATMRPSLSAEAR